MLNINGWEANEESRVERRVTLFHIKTHVDASTALLKALFSILLNNLTFIYRKFYSFALMFTKSSAAYLLYVEKGCLKAKIVKSVPFGITSE